MAQTSPASAGAPSLRVRVIERVRHAGTACDGGVNLSYLRCYWQWPIGHRWESIVDRRYAYKRCRECGKTTPIGSKGREPPTQMYGD